MTTFILVTHTYFHQIIYTQYYFQLKDDGRIGGHKQINKPRFYIISKQLTRLQNTITVLKKPFTTTYQLHITTVPKKIIC